MFRTQLLMFLIELNIELARSQYFLQHVCLKLNAFVFIDLVPNLQRCITWYLY